MKARRLLLTHFSQRYVKEESLKRQALDEEMVVLRMAYDQMRVKLGDWKVVAAYQPLIARMLADKGEE